MRQLRTPMNRATGLHYRARREFLSQTIAQRSGMVKPEINTLRSTEVHTADATHRFTNRKGMRAGHSVGLAISDEDAFALMTPLKFAMQARQRGDSVSLFFYGPAVRAVTRGFEARIGGPARPFDQFGPPTPERGGYMRPELLIAGLKAAGVKLYVCGSSMREFGVTNDDLAFETEIAEYDSFLSNSETSDLHIYV